MLVCTTYNYDILVWECDNEDEIASFLDVRTMNQELLISLLCGDQCHCWKWAMGNMEKLHSQSPCSKCCQGARVMKWGVANSYCHGNWMR